MEGNFTMIPNAVDDDGLSLGAARLYWALMRYTNIGRDNGYRAYPSTETLAKKCRMGEDAVTDGVNELVQAGWIGDMKKGANNGNIYILNVEKKVNRELIERRAENQKKNRHKTLAANARKATKDTGTQHTGVSRPQPVPVSEAGAGRPQRPTVTGDGGKNNTNVTRLISLPVSDETAKQGEVGKEQGDYPGTSWLLGKVVQHNLLRVPAPRSADEPKLYKRWQAQLKQLLNLGTRDEIQRALPNVFYRDWQVDEPSQLYRALEREIRYNREEAKRAEEYALDFVQPLPPRTEEPNYAPMPKDIGLKRNLS